MLPRLCLAAALTLLLAIAAGCGSRPGESGSDSSVQAVATTTQVADMVRAVGGDRVSVTQILQPNSDPHDYEPRPSDARAIEGADVVFRSGGEVDEWMDDLIEFGGGGTRVVDVSGSVRLRGDDPHWWQDPHNAVHAVAAIDRGLRKAGAKGYDARAYTERVRGLDRDVAACIDRLPRSQRKLVTSHDALGYFTDRYGLDTVGAVIPSQSTQAQPSSKAVNRLVDQIRRQKVAAIFPESSLNPKIEKAVARESGARVGGALWADTLGPNGSRGATYIGSIRDNTDKIVRGLSGGRVRCR